MIGDIVLFQMACCKTVLDMPIVMRQNASFDYLYIDDLVQIVEWFINNSPSKKSYNVCSGEVYDYVELANQILDVADKDLEIIIEKEGWRGEYSGDIRC